MLDFLKPRKVLDEATVAWQFELYRWALNEFDSHLFFQKSVLVTPTNTHFPGRVESVQGMAELVFDRVRKYALLSHWSCRLVPVSEFDPQAQQPVNIPRPLRIGDDSAAGFEGAPLLIAYEPAQVRDPQALIASLAHILAHYLATMAESPPPGGADNWPHACEILAVYLGFGLMLSNSAFTVRTSGCGGCGAAAVGRDNHLSQYDLTYALALFATLKGVPDKMLLCHLKRSLRGYYKAAKRDIASRGEAVERLLHG